MTAPETGPYRDLVRERTGYYVDVFRGKDKHGKDFHVVRATDYGAYDPGTRDRFADAVRAVRPELADSDSDGQVPWASFPVEDGKGQYVDWLVGLVENPSTAPQPAPSAYVPVTPRAAWSRTRRARRVRGFGYGRTGNTIRIVWGALVLGLIIGGNTGVYFKLHRDTTPAAAPTTSSAPAPVPTASGGPTIGSPFLDDQPKPPPATRNAGLPESTLLGPVYAGGDSTEDRDLNYGFAFRLPTGWTCVDPGTTPGAVYRFCIEGEPGQVGGRVRMVQRDCPAGCTAAERAKLATDWLGRWSDIPKLPAFKALDGNTSYAAYLAGDKVYLVVSRFWQGHQLGVVLDGPPDRETVLRKIGDDILTQATG